MKPTPAPHRLPSAVARAVALAALALPLSACGVNFGAQTDQVYTPADGSNARDGEVKVLNAIIVSDEPGSGRFIAGLANSDPDNDDTVESVEGVDEFAGLTFSVDGGESSIPAGGALQLADDDAAMVSVSGDPELLAVGKYVRVRVVFARGEAASVNVPVMEPGETYADVELPEAPPTDAAEG